MRSLVLLSDSLFSLSSSLPDTDQQLSHLKLSIDADTHSVYVSYITASSPSSASVAIIDASLQELLAASALPPMMLPPSVNGAAVVHVQHLPDLESVVVAFEHGDIVMVPVSSLMDPESLLMSVESGMDVSVQSMFVSQHQCTKNKITRGKWETNTHMIWTVYMEIDYI